MRFEVVEFIELAFQPGRSMPPPSENIVGEFDLEDDAVAAARSARESFIRENGVRRDAWWLVRQPGSQLASWIADAASDREFGSRPSHRSTRRDLGRALPPGLKTPRCT